MQIDFVCLSVFCLVNNILIVRVFHFAVTEEIMCNDVLTFCPYRASANLLFVLSSEASAEEANLQ